MKNKHFLFLALLALGTACGEKHNTMEIPLPSQKTAPTAITLSKADWAAPVF